MRGNSLSNMKLWKKIAILSAAFALILIVFKSSSKNDRAEVIIINNKFLPTNRFNDTLYRIRKDVSLLIRYTPELSAYLNHTVFSFLASFPNIPIIIVSDSLIAQEDMASLYNLPNVKVTNMEIDLLHLTVDRNALNQIRTKYLFIVPLGVLSISSDKMLSLIENLENFGGTFLAVPKKNSRLKCLKMNLNLIQWTVEYHKDENNNICDGVDGIHGIFAKTEALRNIGEPFMLPFPEALYLQAKALNMKTKILDTIKLNPVDFRIQVENQKQIKQYQRHKMYDKLKIKKVLRENKVTEWYGCTRKTQRCFPNVVNSVPEFLRQGRWTPPCCLRVLRETTKHVFETLKKYNVTFWLEGGSLLGAMRSKDIIPWDYDVDVGVYADDILKCPFIEKIHKKKVTKRVFPQVTDDKGFVWEKSVPEEGDFYRVQASQTNRLHVDIFPFYSKNGIMTKNSWFSDHPQDKEFPEHFLKPLTTIEFAGTIAPAPNNIRDFLELKFGKGCVEDPKYPNSKMFPFPNEHKHFFSNETLHYDLN